MPFEMFPATRSTDRGKRKRGDDDDDDLKNSNVDGGTEAATATDEEVEEFFAILRRLHAATKSIKKIDGASRLLIGKRSKPISEVEIAGDRSKTPELKMKTRSLNLDLNLEPAFNESDDKREKSEPESESECFVIRSR